MADASGFGLGCSFAQAKESKASNGKEYNFIRHLFSTGTQDKPLIANYQNINGMGALKFGMAGRIKYVSLPKDQQL